MKKEEFLRTFCYPMTNADIELDSVIAEAIAEHERKQWHNYPEEKPDKDGAYLVAMHYNGKTQVHDADYVCVTGRWLRFWDMTGIIIAWRELPAPYQPQEGGEK